MIGALALGIICAASVVQLDFQVSKGPPPQFSVGQKFVASLFIWTYAAGFGYVALRWLRKYYLLAAGIMIALMASNGFDVFEIAAAVTFFGPMLAPCLWALPTVFLLILKLGRY